jgi:anti-sigma B factor antagonist
MSVDRAEFEPFRCEVDPHRASVVVRPVGELDLATAPVVDAQLSELVEAGFASLVLDLRQLRFLDSTGLRLLLSWDARSRAEGVDLSLIPGPAPVQRVIDVAGVAHLLPFARLSQAGDDASITPREGR